MSYADWLTWCSSYETTAFSGFSGNQISLDAYNEAVEAFYNLANYLGPTTYANGVYKLAMHKLILSSNLCASPLNSLYTKYSVESNRSLGMVQTASSDRTSSTRVIPNAVQDADADMMLLWCTPYGQQVEALFEQIRPYVTVI